MKHTVVVHGSGPSETLDAFEARIRREERDRVLEEIAPLIDRLQPRGGRPRKDGAPTALEIVLRYLQLTVKELRDDGEARRQLLQEIAGQRPNFDQRTIERWIQSAVGRKKVLP
jgi:hypothetical protein